MEASPLSAEVMPAAARTYDRAFELITGDRRNSYGAVSKSFERMALLFSGVLHHKLTSPVTAHEAGLLMCALKVGREAAKPAEDNRVDLCGYAGLLAELEAAAVTAKETKP